MGQNPFYQTGPDQSSISNTAKCGQNRRCLRLATLTNELLLGIHTGRWWKTRRHKVVFQASNTLHRTTSCRMITTTSILRALGDLKGHNDNTDIHGRPAACTYMYRLDVIIILGARPASQVLGVIDSSDEPVIFSRKRALLVHACQGDALISHL